MNKSFFFYSVLAIPLAFIGIPIYVYIAYFYSNSFLLSVSAIGSVILLSRLVDVFQDPLIGFFSDKLINAGVARKKIILFNIPLLAVSFYCLFNPIATSNYALYVWMALSLIFVYTFFSFIVINYNAIAAQIAADYNSRTTVNAFRESFGLVGIILASILPTLISYISGSTFEQSLSSMAIFLTPALIIFAILFYWKVDIPNFDSNHNNAIKIFQNIRQIWRDILFRRLLVVFFVNSLAVSIPAATFLFFVEDVLLVKDQAGVFLLLYFLSAAFMMPIWNLTAKKYGKKRAWIISIAISIAIFFWAFFLNNANYHQFYFICLFSGIALGADLAIPPAILADIVNASQDTKSRISSYYAVWNMTSKLALAIASSAALIILGLTGYRDSQGGQDPHSLLILSLIYTILPCIIKLLVIFILFKLKIEEND